MKNYPIWVHDETTPKPDARIFYEVAKNGVFLHKKMRYWDTVVPVRGIDFLQDADSTFTLGLPPIPGALMRDMGYFFAWASSLYFTEAMVILWWNEATSSYRISAPVQRVSSGSISYDMPDRLKDEYPVGTFHSHGSGGAFHSSIDQCDERSFDGIHGTFGRIYGLRTGSFFELSVEAAINGTRFPLDVLATVGGLVSDEDQKDSEKREPKQDPDEGLRKEDPLVSGFLHSLQSKESRLAKRFRLTDEFRFPGPYMPPEEWRTALRIKSWTGSRWWKLGTHSPDDAVVPKPKTISADTKKPTGDKIQTDPLTPSTNPSRARDPQPQGTSKGGANQNTAPSMDQRQNMPWWRHVLERERRAAASKAEKDKKP